MISSQEDAPNTRGRALLELENLRIRATTAQSVIATANATTVLVLQQQKSVIAILSSVCCARKLEADHIAEIGKFSYEIIRRGKCFAY